MQTALAGEGEEQQQEEKVEGEKGEVEKGNRVLALAVGAITHRKGGEAEEKRRSEAGDRGPPRAGSREEVSGEGGR